MRCRKVMVLVATVMIPTMAWAGDRVVQSAPVLGDAGLIALGAGLLGAGVALLRKR